MFIDEIERIKDKKTIIEKVIDVSDVKNLFLLVRNIAKQNEILEEVINSWEGLRSHDYTGVACEGGTKKTATDYIEKIDALRADVDICDHYVTLSFLMNCQNTLGRFDERCVFNRLVLRGLSLKEITNSERLKYKEYYYPEYAIKYGEGYLIDTIIKEVGDELNWEKVERTTYRIRLKALEKIDYDSAIRKTKEDYIKWICSATTIKDIQKQNDTKCH